jgi:glycosyltransferase involved in cell wall biosynthesis
METASGLYPQPFRIALVTDGLFPLSIGGMQKHSVRLAAYLAEAGAEVLLFHPHPGARMSDLFSDCQCRKITDIYIPWPEMPSFPGHYLLQNYRYSKAVHEKLKELNGSLHAVYIQGFSGWKSIVSGLKNIPLVLNLHGMEMFQTIKGIKNHLNGFMLRQPATHLIKNADAVVSLGGKLSDLIKRVVPEQRVIELPVGIDASWFQEYNTKKEGAVRTFLFVGRHEWRKGLDLLNAVIPSLAEQFTSSVRFEFVGAIPQESRLEHPSVHYYGPINDEVRLRNIFQKASFLVCPSYSEGMPTVILEAMASALPVVATNVGAVSLLVSEKNGCIVEAGDALALKHAMQEMLELSEVDYRAACENSASLAQNFQWKIVGASTLYQLKGLYLELSAREP